jgi:uncharacterized protein (TIGR03437 family)
MELFGFVAGGITTPLITHADYSLVGPSSAGLVPAARGEQVIGWGTGDCSTPAVTVAGAMGVVTFSGRVEPGLCQLNFTVPSTATGVSELKISSSSESYNLWVTQ